MKRIASNKDLNYLTELKSSIDKVISILDKIPLSDSDLSDLFPLVALHQRLTLEIKSSNIPELSDLINSSLN